MPTIVSVLLTGAIWGAFAWLLGARALGPSVWGGVVVSPLIGVAVTALIHPRFLSARGWARGAWALASVYLGAICFSVGCGIVAAVRAGAGRGPSFERLVEPVVGVLWGITMTGYLLFLWPLAYATHWWLEYRAE